MHSEQVKHWKEHLRELYRTHVTINRTSGRPTKGTVAYFIHRMHKCKFPRVQLIEAANFILSLNDQDPDEVYALLLQEVCPDYIPLADCLEVVAFARAQRRFPRVPACTKEDWVAPPRAQDTSPDAVHRLYETWVEGTSTERPALWEDFDAVMKERKHTHHPTPYMQACRVYSLMLLMFSPRMKTWNYYFSQSGVLNTYRPKVQEIMMAMDLVQPSVTSLKRDRTPVVLTTKLEDMKQYKCGLAMPAPLARHFDGAVDLFNLDAPPQDTALDALIRIEFEAALGA